MLADMSTALADQLNEELAVRQDMLFSIPGGSECVHETHGLVHIQQNAAEARGRGNLHADANLDDFCLLGNGGVGGGD